MTPRRVTNRGLSTRTWRSNSTRPLHPSTTRPSFQSAAYVPDLQPSRQSPPTRTALLTTGPLADPLGAAELPFRRRKSYDWHCLKEPAPAAPLDYLRPTPFRAIPPSMARAPHACTSAPTTGPPSGLGDGDSPPCHESEPVDEDLEVELDLSPSPLHDPELHSSWQPTFPTFSPVGSPPDSDSPSDDPVPSRTRSERRAPLLRRLALPPSDGPALPP